MCRLQTSSIAHAATGCPDNSYRRPYSNLCYKPLLDQTLNFTAARSHVTSLGMQLLSIKSQYEQDWVASTFAVEGYAWEAVWLDSSEETSIWTWLGSTTLPCTCTPLRWNFKITIRVVYYRRVAPAAAGVSGGVTTQLHDASVGG